MSGGHLLCADRSGTKTHCDGAENVVKIGFGGRVYEYYERKQSADSGRRV